MNLQLPKESAQLIAMIAKPHVKNVIAEGDAETATVFQCIIKTLEMAVKNKMGIEFK